jgi:uncharacterized SAM-binding protein YcdF (DUF218 family)
MLLVWLAGFGWFVASSLALRSAPAAPTDAIVVLTGGRQRLEAGLALLVAGRGRQLFISGVNPHVDQAVLLRALGPAAEREACCIVLGHRSDDTAGNAAETAGWMRRQGYRSLRLVTSWYHMRRALVEFRRAMPDATIVPQPVFALRVDPEDWWGWHGAALLLVGEYDKYIAAWLLSAVVGAPPMPAGPAPGGRPTGGRGGMASLLLR